MCEGISHSDEDCVGDDSRDDVIGDAAAEGISDECPAVKELFEVDEQYFTDTGSQSELQDTQHGTEISRVEISISNSTGNVPVGACTRSVPESVPCISVSKTAVIYSSSSGVHLSLSDQLSQLQSHLPSHHTAGLMHYRSALFGPQQVGQVTIGTNVPASADGDASIDDGSYHRIDSLEELKGSLLAYKCIVNAIPSKIDKCSVVSLTDCDDSSSHSSNIDDDILSARCPEVQSSDIMYGGHVTLYAAKIPMEGFSISPQSPCIDPL